MRRSGFGFASMALLIALAGCGDRPLPTPSGDGGRRDSGSAIDGGEDGSEARDAGAGDDAGARDDAGSSDGGDDRDGGLGDSGGRGDAGAEGGVGSEPDGGSADAGSTDAGPCEPPVCPPPPDGCRYEGMTRCACGVLTCPMGDCGGITCAENQYCDYTTPFSCGGAGVCRDRPSVCPEVYMPVCGCDGATYNNACDAHMFGQDVAFEGECPPAMSCRDVGCPEFMMCIRCGDRDICLPLGATC
jgi:hypothetical protein